MGVMIAKAMGNNVTVISTRLIYWRVLIRKSLEEREFQFAFTYVLFSVTHFLKGSKMVQNCSLFYIHFFQS